MTTREDALRLGCWDVHQAKGREGAIVVPRERAFCAQLHAGTERYDAAPWHLVNEGRWYEPSGSLRSPGDSRTVTSTGRRLGGAWSRCEGSSREQQQLHALVYSVNKEVLGPRLP